MAIISRKYDFKGGTSAKSGQVDEELDQLVAAHNSLASTTPDDSGAHAIGSAPISGVVGANVHEQLVSMEEQIQSAVGGIVPPGTVTNAMLQPGAVSEDKLTDVLSQKVNGGLIDFLSRQAIINGNFDIWQRGASVVNPISSLYTADRFKVERNADTSTFPNVTHSKVAAAPGEIPGSIFFYRISTDGAGTPASANAFYQMGQWIENGTRFLCGVGKKITISFYARSSIANKRIGVYAKQGYGSGGAPSVAESIIGTTFTLTPNWTKYTVTLDTKTLAGKTFGTNSDDFLSIHLIEVWGSGSQILVGATTPESFGGAGNIDIAQLRVGVGDLPFQPRSFSEELALCQRYYEKSYDYGTAPGTATSSGAENVVAISVDNLAKQDTRFKVRKRITPTVTVYSAQNGAVGSVSEFTGVGTFSSDRAVNTSLTSESSYVIGKPGAFNANNFERWHWTADAEL